MISFPRFTVVLVLTMVGLAVVAYLADEFLNFEWPTGASSFIPIMIASITEGNRYTRRHGELLRGKNAWLSAVIGTVIWFFISFLAVVLVSLVMAGDLSVLQVFGAIPPMLLIAIVIGMGAMCVLASRVFFSLGGKSVIRAQEAQEKAARRS